MTSIKMMHMIKYTIFLCVSFLPCEVVTKILFKEVNLQNVIQRSAYGEHIIFRLY